MGDKARAQTTAVPDNTFLNSMGTNTHIDQGVSEASYEPLFTYTGIRNTRDSLRNVQGLINLHNNTIVSGVSTGVLCDILSGDFTAMIPGGNSLAAAGALLSFEGPNEPNNAPINYPYPSGPQGGGSGTWVPVADYQRDLYSAVKSSSTLKNYPVFGVSEDGAETDNVGLQFLTIPTGAGAVLPDGTQFSDYANCHNYVDNGGNYSDNKAWIAAEPALPSNTDGMYGEYTGVTWGHQYTAYPTTNTTLPKVTTETGWGTLGNGAITETQQGYVFLDVYLSQFKRGWSYTFIYEMRDGEGGDTTGEGIYHSDSTPKASATDIHNLTTILADVTSFTPGSLNYTIPSEPSTVHDLLLQKSNSTFYLVVWDEKFSTAGNDAVSVNLGTAATTVQIYDPTIGTTVQTTLNNVTTIPLTLKDHPLILAITPSSGGSAPSAPTGLTATAGNAQVVLNWTASSGATSYNVYRGTTAGGESTTAIATGITTTSYTNTGLTNGTTYYYKVAAVNSSGTSGYSNEASATPTSSGGSTGTVVNFHANGLFSGQGAYSDTGHNYWNTAANNGTTSSGLASDGVTSTAVTFTISNALYYPGYSTSATTDMFSPMAYNNTSSSTITMALNNVPAGTYNLYVYGGNLTAQTRGTSFTFGGTTLSTTNNGSETYVQGANYVVFTGLTPVNGTISGTAVPGPHGGGETDFNGLQLVQVSGGGGSAPSAPTGLTATAGNAQVVLNWTASSGATSYNVYRGTTAGGESTTAIATGITTTSYTNTGLTNGTTYYYKVAAVNSSGTSGYSNEASATPTSSGGSTGTVVNFHANGLFSGQGAYSDTGHNYWNTAANNGTTSSGLASDGVTSTAVTFTISNALYYPGYSTSATTDMFSPMAYNNTSSSTITMALNNVPAGTYNLYVYGGNLTAQTRGTSFTFGGTTLSTTNNGSETYVQGANYVVFTGLTPVNGTISGTAVPGPHGGGETDFNGLQLVQVSGGGGSAPSAPTGLTATAGNAQVVLNWTASSGATSYNVYRGTTAGGESTTAIATGITTTSYTNTGLTNGTTYYYKVAAVNSSGTSGYSNEASATPTSSGGSTGTVVNFHANGLFSGQGAYSDTGHNYWNTAANNGTTSSGLASDGVTSTAVTFTISNALYYPGYSTSATTDMFSPMAYNNTSSSTITMALNNVPAGTYNLYVYGGNLTAQTRGTSFTFGGTTLSTTNNGSETYVQGANYVVFTGLTPVNGTISGTAVPGPHGGGETDFNGLQLVQVSGGSNAVLAVAIKQAATAGMETELSTGGTGTGHTSRSVAYHSTISAVNSSGPTGKSEGTSVPPLSYAYAVPNGRYKAEVLNNGVALTSAGISDGSVVMSQIYTGAVTQQWIVTNLGNNVIEITLSGTGEALEAPRGTMFNGAALDVSSYIGATYQKWTAIRVGRAIVLVNLNSGFVVNVNNDSNSPSTSVIQAIPGTSLNEEWTLSAP